MFNCTCCCIIINFINDTETEFIWRTLLKLSQGTANPKQPYNMACASWEDSDQTMQSDHLISVFAEEVRVLGSHTAADRDSGKTTQRCRLIWVFAGLTYFWFVLASSPGPAARAPQACILVTFHILIPDIKNPNFCALNGN